MVRAWLSRSDAQDSINIRWNGGAFLTIFDSRDEDVSGAALYVRAAASELSDPDAIDRAVQAIYRRRRQPPPPLSVFQAPSLHRAYQAVTLTEWTNVVHDDSTPPWDERVEIQLED